MRKPNVNLIDMNYIIRHLRSLRTTMMSFLSRIHFCPNSYFCRHHFLESVVWCSNKYLPSERAIIAKNRDPLLYITSKSILQALQVTIPTSPHLFSSEVLSEIYQKLSPQQITTIFDSFLHE